jgi:putative PIN family toxin of toxin-antitoxin system
VRIVFDTNVVLSALLFSGGRLAWLRRAWRDGVLEPIVSRATILELVTALAYPKFGLSAEDRERLLADYLPFADVVLPDDSASPVPLGRDPHDQVFLDLAAMSDADALVRGDKDLLAMEGRCPFPILSAKDLAERLP